MRVSLWMSYEDGAEFSIGLSDHAEDSSLPEHLRGTFRPLGEGFVSGVYTAPSGSTFTLASDRDEAVSLGIGDVYGPPAYRGRPYLVVFDGVHQTFMSLASSLRDVARWEYLDSQQPTWSPWETSADHWPRWAVHIDGACVYDTWAVDATSAIRNASGHADFQSRLADGSIITAARVGGSATKLTGYAALAHAEAEGLTLRKYADPTEGERTGITIDEAYEIAAQDAGLLWIEAEAACADFS